MSPIEQMKSLMKYLPKKDIVLGFKFLSNREFESLQSLIDSAIYKVNKSIESENPKAEYQDIDLEKLQTLKSVVDTYALCIFPEDEKDKYDEDSLWEE